MGPGFSRILEQFVRSPFFRSWMRVRYAVAGVSAFAAFFALAACLRLSDVCAPNFFVNRSTRPSVSMSFWRPVKNGWQFEQISRRSSSLVDRVFQVAPQAQQWLRNIQEVLAMGEYKTGMFYHNKGSYPAATNRLHSLVDQYPLFSGADAIAQSKQESLQGVWQTVEVVVSGPGSRTIEIPEPRPNLTVVTAKYYSRVEVHAEGPRPIPADVTKATADELRAKALPVTGKGRNPPPTINSRPSVLPPPKSPAPRLW